MVMPSEAKRLLNTTIRSLRDRLLADLRGATESAYRLSLPVAHAGLDEARRLRRARLEAWIGEQVRAASGREDELRARFLDEVVEQAAATLLNRLVFLRLMEAWGLRDEQVLTGGWSSRGYRDFRELAPGLTHDATEGYALLLGLVFEDLAEDLPGLFGDVGLGALVPVPDATLRGVVEALDQPELAVCWLDDTTPGWVYQYWNDPRREALDVKLNQGGKVEPHEIASKTQMFTERYMVEWLLQNSLGAIWMAICRKHGWTPEVEATGVLAELEERRGDWRRRREAGEVELDALMPIRGDVEERWKYWVEQPIPADAVEKARDSVRDLTLIDPACGSGHFVVIAFGLLAALYREEARHRGEVGQEQWSDRAIAERILEHNLAGIDLDPRAVQIAAASLWLKAKALAPDAAPARMNLVASSLRLGALPEDDPARVELRRRVQEEVGLPGDLTDGLVAALAGADHIGSLLKVDKAIEESLDAYERRRSRGEVQQGDLLTGGFAPQQRAVDFQRDQASVLQGLEAFLARHGGGEDLGLRLRGEQLAAGLRLVRLLREGQYDLVVGNPPYQGTAKMADAAYVQKHYKLGKADLYAAFLLRGLELAREGGTSALLTMRNWMFIKQYAGLREHLLEKYDLRMLGDFAVGAFAEVGGAVVSVVVSGFRKARPTDEVSVALQPTALDDGTTDSGRTPRKRAAVLAGVGRFEYAVSDLSAVDASPLVYWWSDVLRRSYREAEKLGLVAVVTAGVQSSPQDRWLRFCWELPRFELFLSRGGHEAGQPVSRAFVPIITGGKGRRWVEPLLEVVRWSDHGLQLKEMHKFRTGTITKRVAGQAHYFKLGVTSTATGHRFEARAHRYQSIPSHMGASVFDRQPAELVCIMNSARPASVLEALNPGLGFEVGDVKRMPLFGVSSTRAIFVRLEEWFGVHEAHREPSVEYLRPGPSPWRHAQDWAQRAVDRPDGDPLPPYEPEYDDPHPTDHASFGVGVALGRFGARGEGILDTAPPDALPDGLLYLSEATEQDSLRHPACASLRTAWEDHGGDIDPKKDLRTWLRVNFFSDVHRQMYENRPIHFPLSSAKKSFVAYANIHRFTETTLRALLANHLLPDLARLDGELADLRSAAQSGDRAAARRAEDRLAKVQKWKDELTEFIANVQQCAEKGPLPPDPKTPVREVDARYVMDLDDGVLVNSAALWPLLAPQWKDPKKWWKQLATAPKAGNKDLDWSHLAARYFPTRVDAKCKKAPSLGVAHGCFWRYHPERAYAWELRLQDEIGPDFTLDEEGSDAARAAFEAENPRKVVELVEAERKRRAKKAKKKAKEQGDLFTGAAQ